MSMFKSIYEFDITYKLDMKANEKAKGRLYGKEVKSFTKLTWYKSVVIETNLGSNFEMGQFKRLFLAYGGCVCGFEFCLPELYVYGTFDKSLWSDPDYDWEKWFDDAMPEYSLLQYTSVKAIEMINKKSLETDGWTSNLTLEMEAKILF
ncbi:hypothetical protein PHJA_001230200 [Phtheirospermum japonicum]|uniref:Uncharacterized protein n=1 Tax=Phtheirospermum japonicum TaxID=374723 RepID=A0A830C3V5_9LAMI|nr:hypothetical protein PHJA_001230200 [Phtheirospermum japonicum]